METSQAQAKEEKKMKNLTLVIAAVCLASLALPAQTPNQQPMPGMHMPMSEPQQNPPSQRQEMPGMQMPEHQNVPPTQEQQMPGMHMPTPAHPEQQVPQPAGPELTLEQLEQMALERNPTLKQAQTEIRAAEGRKRQAGLYPNPTIGYMGEQIRGGSFHGGEQGAFVQQDIVLGGKLGAARRVFEQERLQAETEAQEQLLRVQNSVRLAYYQSLAAQQMLELRQKLLGLTQDARETTKQLLNVGQADQPDLLQAEIEAERAQLDLEAARFNQERLWKALTAVVGNPELPFSRLAGNLEEVPDVDVQEWVQKIVEESPAAKITSLEISRAEAELDRARREPIPDLQLRGGLQQNREISELSGRPVGLQGFAEIGVRIPLFNRNQGGVQAAKAGIDRAKEEQERVSLLLRDRAASLVQNYLTARVAVEQYRSRMIPSAEKAYQLYLAKYNNMAAAYPQVLVAQRTLFQLRSDYVTSLENLWVSTTALRGFMLTDGLEAPTSPQEIDRPVRETNLPMSNSMTTQK